MSWPAGTGPRLYKQIVVSRVNLFFFIFFYWIEFKQRYVLDYSVVVICMFSSKTKLQFIYQTVAAILSVQTKPSSWPLLYIVLYVFPTTGGDWRRYICSVLSPASSAGPRSITTVGFTNFLAERNSIGTS